MNRDLLDAGPFVYCDVQDKVLHAARHICSLGEFCHKNS